MQFLENFRKCEKIQRRYTCHGKKKKELFNIRTKLSQYKVFHRTSINNRNKKYKDTYEQACLFRAFNTIIK